MTIDPKEIEKFRTRVNKVVAADKPRKDADASLLWVLLMYLRETDQGKIADIYEQASMELNEHERQH